MRSLSPFRPSAARLVLLMLAVGAAQPGASFAQAAPTPLDPTTLPKYVTPLVIPAQMPPSSAQPCTGSGCPSANYNLSLRQFKQQVLPGGPFNALTGRKDSYPATTVWSYGRQQDPVPAVAPAPATTTTFNAPALSVENTAGVATSVRWINELVAIDPSTGRPYAPGSGKRSFLSHLTPIDPTLHWANPGKVPCLSSVPGGADVASTDCTPDPKLLPLDAMGNVLPYTGPVTMVTHVHGADVTPDSDGYAEAWWLPQADNIPAGFAAKGRQYDQNNRNNVLPGSAWFSYPNTQPQTTLWYHDHSLGITHNNVYSGAAGFWPIRANATSLNTLYRADLPTCALPGSFSPFGRGTNPALSYPTTVSCSNGANPTLVSQVGSLLNGLLGAVGGLLNLNPTAAGCDPNFNLACRAMIREIPLVLADRSFLSDGSLFYSGSRNDATPVNPGVNVPFAPASDIAPIINPEFFASAITVNGTTYPAMQVAAQRYRLRLLNGADARSYNLSLWALNPTQAAAAHTLLVKANGVDSSLPNEAYRGGAFVGIKATVTFPAGTELPFYQIGAEQGFLPKVVKIMTGRMAALPGGSGAADVALKACLPASSGTASNPQDPNCERGLLLTPAERADTVVDFSGVATGSVVRMINTAQDSPFQGFPIVDPAPTPGATDQAMEFNVVAKFTTAANTSGVAPAPDLSTAPWQLSMSGVAEAPLVADKTQPVRTVSLQEYQSQVLCASTDPLSGAISQIASFPIPQTTGFDTTCANTLSGGAPYGPRIDMLGQLAAGAPVSYHWADPITQTPALNKVQEWDVYNFTPDSHPIHVHGTRFQILSRENLVVDPATNKATVPAAVTTTSYSALPTEAGYKDTLDALPRSRIRMLANFTRPGLYQWHCHISEHEDNEMMLPMCVVPAGSSPSACLPGANPTGVTAPPGVAISKAAQ